MTCQTIMFPSPLVIAASDTVAQSKAATFDSFQDISFLGDDVAVAHPDTSLSEALLLIYRRNGVLPVVERESRKLLGVVTADRALARILEVH